MKIYIKYSLKHNIPHFYYHQLRKCIEIHYTREPSTLSIVSRDLHILPTRDAKLCIVEYAKCSFSIQFEF